MNGKKGKQSHVNVAKRIAASNRKQREKKFKKITLPKLKAEVSNANEHDI